MPSLVSEFLINPVLRQARRFSSGFATEPDSEDHGGSSNRRSVIPTSGTGERPSSASHASPDSSSAAIDWHLASALSSPSPSSTDHETLHDARSPGLLDDPASETASTDSAPPRLAMGSDGQNLLPEDDGMSALRRRILAIQSRDLPPEEKARLMHRLLMEGYNQSRLTLQRKLDPQRPESPLSTSLSEQYLAARPLQTLNKLLNHIGEGFMPLKLELTKDDLRPTYAPRVPLQDGQERYGSAEDVEDDQDDDDHNDDDEGSQERPLGCRHYRRNVKMQCVTCERWYTCRFCHDLAEDHVLPRKETRNMLCMLCGCAQRVSDTCLKCGTAAARYYCGVCKLWNDDVNKPIYHCNDCGICRVGQGLGKDFFHCNKCMACISISVSTTHRCIERSIDCDCPICGDYMFSSPRQVVFMLCGHSIHRRCYEEHMKSSYKCPICNKSVVNMETQFRNYDIAIATQPMPAEYHDARAKVFCNDCSAKSQAAYHWLGLKCGVCRSYNTVQLQLLNMPNGTDEPGEDHDHDQDQDQDQDQDHGPTTADDDADAAAAVATEPPRQPGPSSSSGLENFASPDVLAARGVPWPRQVAGHRPGASIGSRQDVPVPVPTFSPFLVPERLARSVSPLPGAGFTDPSVATALLPSPPPLPPGETDDSEADDDDALDFWGGDDPRGVTSAESAVGNESDEDGSDDGSEWTDDDDDDDDCDFEFEEDEDEDEEEEISLLGHR